MIEVNYHLHFDSKKDLILFTYKIGGMPEITIALDSNTFLQVADHIKQYTPAFFDGVRKRLASGESGDIKSVFDPAEWEKLMKLKKEREDDQREG